MRRELSKAIELKPDFPESYHLLAFVNLVMGEQLDESIAIIKRGIALSPGSEEFLFVLAQLYMRKQNFEQAQKVMEPLAANAADPQIRVNARSMLASISTIQEQLARIRAGEKEQSPMVRVEDDKSEAVQEVDPSEYLRQALRKPAAGETQVEAVLLRIECDARGIIFVVKIDDRMLKLKTDSFEHVSMTTYSSDIKGEITCGPRKPEIKVVLCYLPRGETRPKVDGVLRSVEFVPQDFQLKVQR
jgi:hypothetical protein